MVIPLILWGHGNPINQLVIAYSNSLYNVYNVNMFNIIPYYWPITNLNQLGMAIQLVTNSPDPVGHRSCGLYLARTAVDGWAANGVAGCHMDLDVGSLHTMVNG